MLPPSLLLQLLEQLQILTLDDVKVMSIKQKINAREDFLVWRGMMPQFRRIVVLVDLVK